MFLASDVHLLPTLALLFPVAVLAAMFAFILARRAWRARTFRRLDRFREHWLKRLPELLSGDTPTCDEFGGPEAREALEAVLVSRLQTATGAGRQLCSLAIERAGLLDRRIQMLRRSPRSHRYERLHSATLLGEMHAPAAVGALLEALEDSWAPLRTAAVRSLGMIASPAAGPALLRAAKKGLPAEPHIWLDALAACVPDPEDFVPLLAEVKAELRPLIARAMAESSTPPRFEALNRLAFDPDPEVRAQVLRALGRSGDERAVPLLIAAASDAVWFVRLRALAALAELRAPGSVGAVLCAMRDRDFRVRQRAAATLAALAARPAEVLEILLGGNDRYAIEGFLSELARAGVFWRALPLLRATDRAVRRQAEQLLALAVAGGNHQEVLYAVEAHPEWRVRLAAARLLARHGGTALAPDVEQRLAAAPTPRLRRVLGYVLRNLQSPVREAGRALARPV